MRAETVSCHDGAAGPGEESWNKNRSLVTTMLLCTGIIDEAWGQPGDA